MFNHLRPFGLLFLLLWGCTLSTHAQSAASKHNFEVARSLDLFNALYRDLDLYYVDTLEAKKHIGDAIDYMLEMLDPYTEYYPEDHTDDLKQLTTGKYAGIGSAILFRTKEGRCVISKPYEGMPAAQAGLLPGDVIMAIDGQALPPCTSTSEKERAAYSERVSAKLRGEAGTTFVLKVRRPGTGKVYAFQLTRCNIVLPSVELSTLVADSIGYIRLRQFIEGTSQEVRRVLTELKQRGARRLILDLRGNPGGVMEEAISTVNLFVPRGREIITIKGKMKDQNRVYRTTSDPQDVDIPLIVLTDGESASSSEITAGALQDYDRALIMGRRTYGKGLVQQSRPLPYKAMLKLTSGRYFIPSGRCVQAYKFKDGMPVHLPDSLSRTFRTAAGRIVKDGGGITPDVELRVDSLPNLLTYLENSEQLDDYCVDYRRRHPQGIASPTTFRLTDEEYAEFTQFMKEHQFTYDNVSLRYLERLRELARFEGYEADAKSTFDLLATKLQHNIDYDFQRWQPRIRRIVEAAIVENYYYDAGRYSYLLREDADVKAAIDMMHNDALRHKLLTGEPDA